MINKGDMLTIALISATIGLICLFVMKGSILTTGTFSEDNAAQLIPSPMPTATPNATIQPSSNITLAVNDDNTLFAVIRSPPSSPAQESTVAPTPSPSLTPTVAMSYAPTPTARPSYQAILDNKPKAKAIPSYKAVKKNMPKRPGK